MVEWQDSRGRYFQVELAGGDDDDPAHGSIIGPPLELWDNLKGLSPEQKLRLHNELYHRGVLTREDAELRPREVEAALKAALKLDAGRVLEAYRGDSDEADR